MKKNFKGIRKKGQGNKFVKENIKRHTEDDSPKYLQTLRSRFFAFAQNDEENKMLKQVQHDVAGSLALGGRGLGRGGTSLQNDVTTCAPLEGEPKSLISKGGKNRLDCFAFARNDKGRHTEDGSPKYLSTNVNLKPSPEFVSSPQLTNKFYPLTKREGKENRKELINLSTYRLIDLKKTAFTLAETLITLGIIGVVAAITIPGLINNYKANKLRTQYLKSYSTLAQMIKLIEQDDIELNDQNTIMNLTKYLPGSTKKEGSDLQDKNNTHNDPFYYYLSNKYKTYDGKGTANKTMFDDVQYALPDGSLLLMEWDDIHYPNGDHHWISVDINGYNNGPNRWGVDLFTFQVLDGKMLAIGDKGSIYTDMSQYCNSQKITNYYNGIACAHLAKTDTEYFKKAVRLK